MSRGVSRLRKSTLTAAVTPIDLPSSLPACPSPRAHRWSAHIPRRRLHKLKHRASLSNLADQPPQDKDTASAMATLLSYLKIPVLASSGLAAVLSGVLYFKQNEIIYPRNIPPGARTEVPKPSQFGISDFEELQIPTPDNESLHAFLIRPSNRNLGRSRNTTILMFHGNAGNIGYRLPIAKVLSEDIGCHVLMLQYRGYGLSTGTPNEKGLMIDAQVGLDYVRERHELSETNIVLYGQSLGGAVSIALASSNHDKGDIKALILENTFTSIRKLIPSAFPPARYLAPLCHQIWPSEENLPKITDIPILFLSGLQDEIVPPSHMAQLFNVSRAREKVWREFPNGSHNDTVVEPGYFDYIDEFIRKVVISRKGYSAGEKGSPRDFEERREEAEKGRKCGRPSRRRSKDFFRTWLRALTEICRSESPSKPNSSEESKSLEQFRSIFSTG